MVIADWAKSLESKMIQDEADPELDVLDLLREFKELLANGLKGEARVKVQNEFMNMADELIEEAREL